MSLLEQNAQKLAELEEDWSDLGPLRWIMFHARFSENVDRREGCLPAQEAAEGLAALAQEEGCETSCYGDQYGDWSVVASKKMEPTAANVTVLEELLKSFVDEECGYFDGWGYPPKKNIHFWPDSRSNISAIRDRAEVLFGSELVLDPFMPTGRGIFSEPIPESWGQFSLVPSDFLRRAQSMPPEDPQPTASAFSQWIYSLYAHAYGSDEDRIQGKDVEGDILAVRLAERRRATLSCIDNGFLRSTHSPWILMHNGLHIDQDSRPDYFRLPQLRVKDEPLRVSPDLLYINKRDSKAVIIEIKHSRLPIPKNLWPNVWAQLWCYSHIDAAASANDVTVIGEVWGDKWSRGYGRGHRRVDGQRLLCLRASVRRNPRAPAYDRFFRRLFQIYGGQLASTGG